MYLKKKSYQEALNGKIFDINSININRVRKKIYDPHPSVDSSKSGLSPFLRKKFFICEPFLSADPSNSVLSEFLLMNFLPCGGPCPPFPSDPPGIFSTGDLAHA